MTRRRPLTLKLGDMRVLGWWSCDDGAGCEYGDRASWCPTYVSSSRDCYNEGATCCQSCEPYRLNITG